MTKKMYFNVDFAFQRASLQTSSKDIFDYTTIGDQDFYEIEYRLKRQVSGSLEIVTEALRRFYMDENVGFVKDKLEIKVN